MWPFTKKTTVTTTTVTIERSLYYPAKFYTDRQVTLDSSVDYFARKSAMTLPTDPLFVNSIEQWRINGDSFEEIRFEGNQYKMIYDNTNSIFYLLQNIGAVNGLFGAPSIEWEDNVYESWSGHLDILEKNELLSILNRTISKEADEYLFCEMDRNQNENLWVGIILQPAMVK